MRKNIYRLSILLVLVMLVFSCQNNSKNKQKASTVTSNNSTTIYHNGDIITMEGDQPQYAEAIVQREGKIVFVGSKKEALEKFKDKAKEVDLKGKTMLPGFIDGHGHMYNTGLMSLFANVMPAPDGPGKNFDSVVKTVKDWMETENGKFIIKKFGWVIANGYDDSQLEEKAHPTADILDKITTEYPVIIMHQSGHLATFNNKALELGDYNKDSKDPKGGHIQKDAKGLPNGVMEEAAFFNFFLPISEEKSDDELKIKAVVSGQKQYAKYGYTTAQEGRSTTDNTDALEKAAKAGDCFIDIVSYPDIAWNKKAAEGDYYSAERKYKNHYRVGGVKLSLDGSPQGKTAWLTKPYFHPPHGQVADYCGFPQRTQEESDTFVKTAFENNWQILCHTNGDAATDRFLQSIEKALQETENNNDHRAVIIHGQTMRKDQIKKAKELGVSISFYPAHTFYWGDWHVESVLGHPRADYISPCRDAIDEGIIITSHHDAPVIPPSAMRVLDAPVNRVTRSGKVLGPDQRITVYEGLQALTTWAAHQHFEENTKGTLTEGKLADFVVLDKNPLKIDPKNIHNIQVVETIKEGKSVYKK